MKKFNRVCITCGKNYEYCSSCRQHSSLPSWKAVYCSEECKDSFNLATDIVQGIITTDKAKEIVKNMKFQNIANYKESVKNAIQKIQNLIKDDEKTLESVDINDIKAESKSKKRKGIAQEKESVE